MNFHDQFLIIQSMATLFKIVDGAWSEWSAWWLCSVTCGGGLRWRNRTCDGTIYGGDYCVGAANESDVCSTEPCPGTPGTRHGRFCSSTLHMHSFYEGSIGQTFSTLYNSWTKFIQIRQSLADAFSTVFSRVYQFSVLSLGTVNRLWLR